MMTFGGFVLLVIVVCLARELLAECGLEGYQLVAAFASAAAIGIVLSEQAMPTGAFTVDKEVAEVYTP